jgi:hypothetical protein
MLKDNGVTTLLYNNKVVPEQATRNMLEMKERTNEGSDFVVKL